MVGRDIDTFSSKDLARSESIMLSVRKMNVQNILKDISFEVHRGEILGVAGLMGSGKTQLAQALYGLLPLDSGEVFINGRRADVTGPGDAIALGIGFVSEERKSHGIFPDMSVLHNLTIAILKRLTRRCGLTFDFKQEEECLRDYTAKLDIRYRSPHQKIEFLSGGNQQKVLLARALAADCKLLLLCEPTRGVDVAAKAEIHSLINELAAKGMAVIVVSSELPEIIGISSRCIAMHQGKITGYISKPEMTESNIIGCAIGQITIGLEEGRL